MKKTTMLLLALLAFFLLTGTVTAAEIPDPDFYFNAAADKQADEDKTDYVYTLTSDPRMAVESYIALLTNTYAFELTDSYLEPEMATWRLESASRDRVRVDYDQGGGEYHVILQADAGISFKSAEAWNWSSQVVSGAEYSDITLLPNFLEHDGTGKYYCRDIGIAFRADSTSAACINSAKAYVDLMQQRGYTLVDSEEKHASNWDMYKWYLHSGQSGLNNVETGINAHVRVRINVYHDKGYCAVDIECVDGITMSGFNNASGNNNSDLFEKDCWWCGYDGKCDECGGTGYVRKNIPGTSKYEQQNYTNCNMGRCKHCGGDGNAPD